jgi:hypothetical protein
MKIRFNMPPFAPSAVLTAGAKYALSGKIRKVLGPSPPFAGLFADSLCE